MDLIPFSVIIISINMAAPIIDSSSTNGFQTSESTSTKGLQTSQNSSKAISVMSTANDSTQQGSPPPSTKQTTSTPTSVNSLTDSATGNTIFPTTNQTAHGTTTLTPTIADSALVVTIAAGTAAGALVLALMIFAVVGLCRRKKTPKEKMENKETNPVKRDSIGSIPGLSGRNNYSAIHNYFQLSSDLVASGPNDEPSFFVAERRASVLSTSTDQYAKVIPKGQYLQSNSTSKADMNLASEDDTSIQRSAKAEGMEVNPLYHSYKKF